VYTGSSLGYVLIQCVYMQGNIRWWAVGRRVQYGLGFGSFWLLIGVLVYYTNYYQPPNCFDGIKNGTETAIDCDGSCVRICPASVLPPKIVWAKSFMIVEGQYNALAYIDNANQTAGTPALKYTFQLLSDGKVVAERSGTTVLPPNSAYPIFEGRLFTEGKAEVTETKILLEPANEWLPASAGRDQFRSLDIKLSGADDKPRLDVKFENTELSSARDVEVVATIFNDAGEPMTASQTYIDEIGARSTKNIVFTWPTSIAKTVRSCSVPTDVVVAIDLSGSMNNDGGEPPQPVTAALAAAADFVHKLQENDQVGVVTFASQATTTAELTKDRGTVAANISELVIASHEETGFTNTIAALEQAQTELNSTRHNSDARRVLVLLTDGLPTAAGTETVVEKTIERARTLSADNIEVYAIGLGAGVDADFIRAIATDSATTAYFAPSAGDLSSIYSNITSSLCTMGPTKIDVIAKTKANFAPLR
jgi:Mg-chelatase subunit ChlD